MCFQNAKKWFRAIVNSASLFVQLFHRGYAHFAVAQQTYYSYAIVAELVRNSSASWPEESAAESTADANRLKTMDYRPSVDATL